jgi:hypothetical protein
MGGAAGRDGVLMLRYRPGRQANGGSGATGKASGICWRLGLGWGGPLNERHLGEKLTRGDHGCNGGLCSMSGFCRWCDYTGGGKGRRGTRVLGCQGCHGETFDEPRTLECPMPSEGMDVERRAEMTICVLR